MGIVRRKMGEFDLDNDYYLNRVDMKNPEAEHTHRFIELVYTFSGKGIHKIDGKEYRVGSGDLLIINFHCRHAVAPVEEFSYVDIMLKPEYVDNTLKGTEDIFLLLSLYNFSDLSSHVIKDNILLHFDGEEKNRIEFLLNWSHEEQQRNAPGGNLVIYSALSMILCLVFRKMAEKQNIKLTINDQLLAYLERNCTSKLTIKNIASQCGYTAEHFSRIFKVYTGQSPIAYVNQCRIKKAIELLEKTDAPIEAVIDACGFSNRTAFFKNFKKYTGVTPLQFRKNQK